MEFLLCNTLCFRKCNEMISAAGNSACIPEKRCYNTRV